MSATLRQLAVFAGVVDHGGFGAAADELAMSQSAVSHTLAAFERAAGSALITRSPAIRPTALGRAILPHARAALAAARAVDTLTINRDEKPEGNIRLAAAQTASHRLVPKLLAMWREVLGGLDIRIFEGSDDELDEWLDTGAVDCAVLVDPSPAPPGGLELARDYFRAVIRTDHPFSSLASVELSELVEDPLLVPTGGCEPQIRKLHTLSGIRFAPAQSVQELSTLLGMVEADLGVGIAPSLANSMLPDGLVMIDIEPRVERRLVFTGPANRPWHPHVTKMREMAKATLLPPPVEPEKQLDFLAN